MDVQHLVYEPRRGGVSQHVISLVRGLPEVRHSVLMNEGLPGVAAELIALGCVVDVVPIASRFTPRAALDALPQRIRARGADVLHLHNVHTGLFGSVAARLGGARRVVFTPQTLDLRRRWLRPPFLALLRRFARGHGAWIAVNQAQAAHMRTLHPRPERVHWIPNAAPPPPPPQDPRAARLALGLDPDAFVIAYVGRLAAEKDPLTLAAAARALPSGCQVAFAGDGPLSDELAAATADLPHVRRLGFVSPPDPVFAAADAVCLPSRYEGLPYAVLEACAHGRPVVAARIDGTADLVLEGETGLGFPPGDAPALARALTRLIEDPSRARALGANARARVETEFSEARSGERLLAVYRGLD
ncbi:MAG: glycosyltransferase family 4 protein [Planctomycetota bacterium]